jgi:hypothetical protein
MPWPPAPPSDPTEGNYRIAFPENNDFINADLRKDPSDNLTNAESYHP